FIKYAVVRDDPNIDPLLTGLVDLVSTDRIVSGIGEQPTVAHLKKFNLNGFTSGCVCVRPDKSMQVLHALKAGDLETANTLIGEFFPLEDLRNTHGPIPVLHHAVAGAGIADTGPLYPLLSELPAATTAPVTTTATELLES
ncbi:MAG: dihydrodipicolinate synthase family protein, partial [Verrucomicrobiales bacterium]|nr:dihydrodipicolinate synthase family protein [Verrucomicrobiales bacterium]